MFLPLVYLRNANSKKPLNASLKDLIVGILKMFRADQREEQVHEKAQRYDSNNDVFHGSDPIEGMGIGNAQAEEADDRQHVNEIHHEPTLLRLDSVVVKTAN